MIRSSTATLVGLMLTMHGVLYTMETKHADLILVTSSTPRYKVIRAEGEHREIVTVTQPTTQYIHSPLIVRSTLAAKALDKKASLSQPTLPTL